MTKSSAFWAVAALALASFAGCGSSGGGASDPGGAGGGTGSSAGSAGSSGEGSGGSAAGTSGSSGGSNGGGAGGSVAGSGGSGGTGGSSGGSGGSGGFDPEFVMGMCRPKGPRLADVPDARTVVEADSVYDVTTVAIHDGTLYWAMQADGIHRLAPGATTPELVVETTLAWEVVVTDTHVYWIEGNQRTLKRGALATLPATAEEVALDVTERALVADEQNIYFTPTGPNGDLLRLSLSAAAGTAPDVLVPGVGPGYLSVADGQLFYTDYITIYRVPTSGGEPVLVTTASGTRDLVAAPDGSVYFVADDELIRQPPNGSTGGHDFVRLAIGSRLSPTSSFNEALDQLGLDGDRIYYREEHGAIAWVKTDGSDCRILAHVPTTSTFDNRKWVMDDTHVYVIERDSRVIAIPK